MILEGLWNFGGGLNTPNPPPRYATEFFHLDRLTDRPEAVSRLIIYGEQAYIRGPNFPPTIRTAAFISVSVTDRFHCMRGNIQHRRHSGYAYCLHEGVFNDSFWAQSFATVTYYLLHDPALNTAEWRDVDCVWNVMTHSDVPRGGVGVFNPPPKFRRPSKIVPNSTRLWKLLKIAEFRTPTLQDVRKKGSKILKLPRFVIVLH